MILGRGDLSNNYKVLEVPEDSSWQEVKKAYLKLKNL